MSQNDADVTGAGGNQPGAPGNPPQGESPPPGTAPPAGTDGPPSEATDTSPPADHEPDKAEADTGGGAVEPVVVRRRRTWLAWGIGAMLVALLAVLLLGFVDWDPFSLKSPASGWWWALALVLLVLAGLAAAFPLVGLASSGESASFGASLLGQAPVMLGIAAMVTVGLYILPVGTHHWWDRWGHHFAVLAGTVTAIAAGLAVAFFKRDLTAPSNVNPRVFGELETLFLRLDAQLASYCPSEGQPAGDDPASEAARQAACATAHRHRDVIAQDLGLPAGTRPPTTGARWVLGTGYIDAWNRLHAAEEALFLVQPEVEVAGNGLHDEMRLKDSTIKNNVDYIDKLRNAVVLFGALRYLSSPPPLPQVVEGDVTPANKAQARVMLREVRQVINEFRDARREGLVRTRNNLLWTGTITGLGGFLLLALAVLRDVPSSAVVAATAFYLVGATVGLFNQLSSGWGDAGAAEEDYGLTQARLLYTPLLSGLAAIGGVLVTTMLYATLSGPLVTRQEGFDVTGGGPEGAEQTALNLVVPEVEDIFNLGEGRFGLVIAAVFGLTPSLLVDRLKNEAERYKADLQSSSAPGSS